MTDSPPVGVIFDMDGVLVDSADAHYESWRLLGLENDRVITRAQFDNSFGQRNAEIIPQRFGQVTPEKLQQLSERKEVLFREIVEQRVPAVPGAAELVRQLQEAGVRLALGSSGPLRNIRIMLQGMGVLELFSQIVSAEDVTRGKPDPQVFTLACERLELYPARCVVIEDAPAGVEAARAAGTRAVAVMMHHTRADLAQADLIVERLADLRVADLIKLATRIGKVE